MTDALHPSIHPSIWVPTHIRKNAKNETPKRRPVFRPVPETLMTIHDSSFNTYTYIHVCILPIWDTRGVLYVCSVRILQIIMVVVEEFFVRMEDENDGTRTRGASRRVSRLGGSVRVVRFLSVRIGFYRIGSRVFRGRVRTVYCVFGVPNHPYVGGLGWLDGWNGWMEWVGMGHGWNGTH